MDDSISAFLWEVIFVIMFGLAVVVCFQLYNNSSSGNRGVETAIENQAGMRENPINEHGIFEISGSDAYYAAMNSEHTAYLQIGNTKYEISDGKIGDTDLKDMIDFSKNYTSDYMTDSNGNVTGVRYKEIQ